MAIGQWLNADAVTALSNAFDGDCPASLG